MRDHRNPHRLDFRAAMDALCDGVLACDANDRVVYVNPAAARLLGRPAEDLVGASAASLRRHDVEVVVSTLPATAGALRICCVHRAAGAGAPRAARHAAAAVNALAALVAALLDGPAEGSAARAIETFARSLGWDVAVLWCVDENGALRSRHVWHAERPELARFVEQTAAMRITGVDTLPGRVRHDGALLWSEDAAADPRYARFVAAARADLHGLVLAPVRGSHDVLAVLELATRRRGRPSDDVLRATATAARHLGQVLERDASERALHESEERLRTALMSVADAVITTDDRGCVVDLNALAESLTGWGAQHARGRPLEEVFRTTHDDDGAPSESPAKVALREGRAISSPRGAHLRRRDDGRVPIAHTASPIRADDGAVRGVVVVFRDETDRRAEDAWRQVLVDVSAALMATLDVDLSFAEVARTVTTCVADGCAVVLVDGPGGDVRVVAASGDRAALGGTDAIVRLATSQNPVIASRDGASILVAPLSRGAQLLGAIALVAGPERRGFTALDVPHARELADRCARAIETAGAFRRTELAVRARDEFLVIASHELKTPLTPLLLQVGALERMLDTRDGPIAMETVRRRLGAVHAGADRLLELVKTMLDVARLGERIEPSEDTADLVAISRNVVARMHDAARRADCELRLDAPSHLVGHWDERWLEQVVTSLVSNAIKYGRGAPVDVRLREGPVGAELHVVDRGIGIERADHERIFELFERAVPQHHYGGFGLGLWIVRRIVDGLGGRVSVDSAAGRGASFTVTLPRERRPLEMSSSTTS